MSRLAVLILVAGTAVTGASDLSSDVAAETCRGLPATHVGTGEPVVGTAGADVIVVGSSASVDAGAGDDLVCLDARPGPLGGNLKTVDAGTGDDTVDSTAAPASFSLEVVLGDGADVFEGGAARERVETGTGPADASLDVVDTAGGDDGVRSGESGGPNPDVVQVGDGDDSLTISGEPTGGSRFDVGPGYNTLGLTAASPAVAVDLADGTLSYRGEPVVSVGGEIGRLLVEGTSAQTRVQVRGSADGDYVQVNRSMRLDIDLGDGNDALVAESPHPESSVAGGRGLDRLTTRSEREPVGLDLARGLLEVDDTVVARIAGVESAVLIAPRVSLRGDGGANVLGWMACHVRAWGGGGDDVLLPGRDGYFEIGPDCSGRSARLSGGPGRDEVGSRQRARMSGGAGNDVLTGSNQRDDLSGGAGADRMRGRDAGDVLRGGPGRDRAIGGEGRDRCAAERRSGCER